MRHAPQTIKPQRDKTHILPSELNKLVSPLTCSSAHTKPLASTVPKQSWSGLVRSKTLLPNSRSECWKTWRMRKKVVFSPSPLSFTYKSVASRVLGEAPPCLPTWISHQHPMLIDVLTCHYASRWILPALRQKTPSSTESWNAFCSVTCLSVPPALGAEVFPTISPLRQI